MGHLTWEIAQLPLYTIWTEGSPREIAWALLHCTAGDLLIALGTLLTALLVIGAKEWPTRGAVTVGATAIALGVAYTIFSEWRNVVVVGSWRYTDAMPTLPLIATGVAPLVQWLVVPSLALWSTRVRALANDTRSP